MPRPGRSTTERAKDFKGTLRQLIRTMSHYKLPLAAAMLFAILSTIFNIAGPKVLAKATTALATGWIAKLRGTGSIDFVYIGRILLFLLGMYLLSSAFSFIQGWLMTGLSQKVCYDFRRQISEKINRLPLAYFEKRTVGEVLSRITNDVDTLGQSLNQSITQLITSVTTMIGVLVMMLSISPRMTLIALLILPVSLALVLVVVKFSQKYFKDSRPPWAWSTVRSRRSTPATMWSRRLTAKPWYWQTSTPPTISCTNPHGRASFSPA